MILTCPSCATSYFTPDDAIPAAGRKVRCQSCSHVWMATTEQPLELTAATSAPGDASEAAPAIAVETPAPELPKAFRARAEQQRRLRRAATHGAVWAGLASLFVGLIGAGWLFRVDVVELYPRAAAAYAMVGAPVNAVGLEFEAVSAKALADRPDTVVVSGALRNVRDREIAVPPIRVALLDDRGAEIGHALIRPDASPVLPGKVQGFAALIRDPGGRGVDVGVAFPGKDAPVPHAPTADHGPKPKARPLPVADAHEMRPALAPAAPGTHLAPVDAAPVARDAHVADPGDTHGGDHGGAGLRGGVDSQGAGALSAAHG